MKQVRRFELSIEIEQADEGGFNALCVELGTPSCGDNFEEARTNIKDAIQVHLASLSETNDFERVFEEKGIAIQTVTVADSEAIEPGEFRYPDTAQCSSAPTPLDACLTGLDVRDTAVSMRVAVYA